MVPEAATTPSPSSAFAPRDVEVTYERMTWTESGSQRISSRSRGERTASSSSGSSAFGLTSDMCLSLGEIIGQPRPSQLLQQRSGQRSKIPHRRRVGGRLLEPAAPPERVELHLQAQL